MTMLLQVIDHFPGRVHYSDGRQSYASVQNVIYSSANGSRDWVRLTELPLAAGWRLCSLTELSRRLCRAGVRHIVPVGTRLCIIGYRTIYTYDLRTGVYETARLSGSLPLNICSDGACVYYGEYGSNKERKPVRIYGGIDGGPVWEPLYELKGIRHIHGVFRDPYSGLFWVTTGDEDEESALWVSDDAFRSLHKVLSGSQQFRAVTLLFTEDYIYFGSDTGREENYLYRFNKRQSETEKLQYTGNAVFYGFKAGPYLFFSTACQPGKHGDRQKLSVWGTQDGVVWEQFLTLHKDIWPMKLFQYGLVIFPGGSGGPGELWLYAVGVREFSGSIKFSLQEG